MPVISLIDSKLLPTMKITVEQTDGDTKVYDCVIDFNAIIKAEEETGKDFSDFRNWQGLHGKEITAIVWAGLDRYHPDVTLHEVRKWLAPAKLWEVWKILFEQVHPGVLAALKIADELDKEEEQTQGKP